MSGDMVNKIIFFVVVCLVQVLILSHVHLFGVATPFFYVYMLLLFRRGYPLWSMMLWCFFMGLVVDMFSNTPGMASFCMTLMAVCQPRLLDLFVPRESGEEIEPTVKTLGTTKFAWYTTLVTFAYCVCFFTLEMFSFFDILHWIGCVVGSTLLTVVLIMVIENVRRGR